MFLARAVLITMTGDVIETIAIIMIMAVPVTAPLANCVNRLSSIHELKSPLHVKGRNTVALIVKLKQALQVYRDKVKQHKPVLNALTQKQPIKARMPRKVHQVKMPAFETVKVPLLVASDVANNEKLEREII